MGEYMLYVWLGIACLGVIIELIEPGTLVSIWFSLGAVIPMVMSFWRINSAVYVSIQFVVFGVVTILSLVFLRKFAKRALFKNSNEKTNMDNFKDKRYKIFEINGDKAYIKINGVGYAVSGEDDKFEVGDFVVVKEFKGNKAIVEKQKEK